MNQSSLPGLVAKRAHRNHDYLELFPGHVFPTGEIDILEHGRNLLIIKSYEHGRTIVDAHRKIWRLLVKFGEVEDAPGNITVVCVWGLGSQVPREYIVFDYQGEHPIKAVTVEEWRRYLLDWWNSSKRGR